MSKPTIIRSPNQRRRLDHSLRLKLCLFVVLCLVAATETLAFSTASSRRATTVLCFARQAPKGCRLSTCSFASNDPNEEQEHEQELPTPLIPTDQDTGDTLESSLFFDVDSLDGEDNDNEDNKEEGNDDILMGQVPTEEFTRDQADMLEEQEDRLYVDEFGIKRKIETCILVGVEDVNAKRRDNRSAAVAAAAAVGVSPDIPLGAYAPPPPPLTPPVGVHPNNNRKKNDDGVYFTLEESMTEMRELIKTSGLELVGEITQRLHEVNPKTYIGSGKVTEAMDLMKIKGSCTVVFDAELSPGQQKALENAFNKNLLQNDFLVQEGDIKVIDRTALILDIFAKHAKTREGKLQVDLALHEYRKPRLTKMWTHLERQSGAGGVGLRGPGESQLEIDKRLLRDRIIVLKQKIDDVQKQRTIHRRGRERTGLPILSLVGYTNAGKSTLLNFLTRAGVMAHPMLFATLDPTTRKVKLPGYKTHPEVLLTDTVGFIQKLPTQLVAAFRATLEEVLEADILIHVIDVSNPMWEKQERSVMSVLTDIGAADKPIVRVLNKIDLLDPEEAEQVRYTAAMTENTVAVSSLLGEGMQDFVAVLEESLADLLVAIEVEIPYSHGDELNVIHEQGNVEVVDYRANGTYVRALVPAAVANRLEKFNVQATPATNADKTEDDGIDWVALGRGRHSVTNDK